MTSDTSDERCKGNCKGHPHRCYNHPKDCGCTDAALLSTDASNVRTFEPFTDGQRPDGWPQVYVSLIDYKSARDEIERLARELAEAYADAHQFNCNTGEALVERDRMRAALERIAAFDPGVFRPLADEIAINNIAVDALAGSVADDAQGEKP